MRETETFVQSRGLGRSSGGLRGGEMGKGVHVRATNTMPRA